MEPTEAVRNRRRWNWTFPAAQCYWVWSFLCKHHLSRGRPNRWKESNELQDRPTNVNVSEVGGSCCRVVFWWARKRVNDAHTSSSCQQAINYRARASLSDAQRREAKIKASAESSASCPAPRTWRRERWCREMLAILRWCLWLPCLFYFRQTVQLHERYLIIAFGILFGIM